MLCAPSSSNSNEPLTANDSEVFQVVTLNSETFIIPQRGGESSLSGKAICSIPFSKQFGSTNSLPKLIWADFPVASPDGCACLAVGCAEGLWVGYRNDSQCEGLRLYHVRGCCSADSVPALHRVLHLKMVTQCAMLEEFGIFLVLANKVKCLIP